MKDPIKTLYNEHETIVLAIDIAGKLDSLLVKDETRYITILSQLIKFFKCYADQYHHRKEEDILFPEMNKKNELLADGVIKEMFENHEDFRGLIRNIEAFLGKKDYLRVQQQLRIYTEALLDHIAVENDEVFQMAETLLTKEELEKIYFRFEDCDRAIGEQQKAAFKDQLREIQNNLI
ncbi:MAG: hemerythrin domain-containing protein [Bacteroidetes bacterium]|nr:hemerythrin domain-containing protein [Bacteroidota bacterium]